MSVLTSEQVRELVKLSANERRARAGAFWFNQLGVALAVPGALEWAADLAFDTPWKKDGEPDNHYGYKDGDDVLRHPADVRNGIACQIRRGGECLRCP